MQPDLPDWKATALSMIPGLAPEIEEAETPHLLWLALYQAFREAYGPPPNDALIGPIYGYAKWCFTQPRLGAWKDDLTTCVCLCFYQNIPLLEAARNDLARWLTAEEFESLAEVLRFHCSPEVFEELARPFRTLRVDAP
jgi:hypothetical protein